MKFLLFSLIACCLFLTYSCDQDRLEGSGDIISDDRTDGAFSAIEVSNALNVTIRQGDNHAVVVTGDDNLISRIRTTTSGGVLSLRLTQGSYRNATLSVAVTTPTLSRLTLDDAISAELVDFVSDQEIVFDINDASKLDLSGSAPNASLEVNDASTINGFDFTTDRCDARVSDASSVRLTVSDRLEGSVRDASTFRFRGNPVVDVTTSDASRLIDDN